MKHSTTDLTSSQKSKWLQKNLMGKEKKIYDTIKFKFEMQIMVDKNWKMLNH